MNPATKIQRNYQVTIPSDIRKKARLRVGDVVEFEMRDDGILLKPMQLIEKSQAWFWTREWQEEERQVDEDVRQGNLKTSEDVDSFLVDLDR